MESLDLRRKDTDSLVKFKEDDSLRYTSVHKVRPLDYDNDVHKAYTEKRLVRSHSMPDRDMQSIIALAEERECYSKTVAAGVKESGEEAETETDPRSLEEKFGHNGLDGSHHVKEGAKRRKHCKSGAQIVLGSIEEETDEIQKDENKPKEVEDCGRRKDTKLEETKEMENEKAGN